MSGVESAVHRYKQIQEQLKEIAKEVKKIKDQNNYKGIAEDNKKIKLQLYEYMVNNSLEELQGISISKLIPSKEKKVLKKQEKREKVESILENELEIDDDEMVNQLADKISEIM